MKRTRMFYMRLLQIIFYSGLLIAATVGIIWDYKMKEVVPIVIRVTCTGLMIIDFILKHSEV